MTKDCHCSLVCVRVLPNPPKAKQTCAFLSWPTNSEIMRKRLFFSPLSVCREKNETKQESQRKRQNTTGDDDDDHDDDKAVDNVASVASGSGCGIPPNWKRSRHQSVAIRYLSTTPFSFRSKTKGQSDFRHGNSLSALSATIKGDGRR